MKSTEFAYWLQGFFELSETNSLSERQTEIIKNHLKLVFVYEIDPSYSDDPKVQDKLQSIHDGKEEPATAKPFSGYNNPMIKC